MESLKKVLTCLTRISIKSLEIFESLTIVGLFLYDLVASKCGVWSLQVPPCPRPLYGTSLWCYKTFYMFGRGVFKIKFFSYFSLMKITSELKNRLEVFTTSSSQFFEEFDHSAVYHKFERVEENIQKIELLSDEANEIVEGLKQPELFNRIVSNVELDDVLLNFSNTLLRIRVSLNSIKKHSIYLKKSKITLELNRRESLKVLSFARSAR